MTTAFDTAHRDLVETLRRTTARLRLAGAEGPFGFRHAQQEDEFLDALRDLTSELGVHLEVRGQAVAAQVQHLEDAFDRSRAGLPDTTATCKCGHSPAWHSRRWCEGKVRTRDGEEDCECSMRTAYIDDQRRPIPTPVGPDESF